ncbi:MAG: MBL fold metallo-hydrolase [Sphingobacteriales bacterium]|nr:MBL fold metallo-hydrolase [Sphingobacteriales bacterium]
MPLYLCSLNSGSNANCYYIGNRDEAVLIDTGLSCRETERRMRQRGLEMEKVKAIFISHEHSDHITGMPGLSKKYRIPVYITNGTFVNSNMPMEEDQLCSFKHASPVRIGALTITPFKKSHDAADPHSFMVSAHGVNVGVITDIGYACKKVINYFGQCHAAFLESNYCPEMLRNGSYPYHLQKRISSDEGHLSNHQALELFQHYRSPELELLILSHLSKNNNSPETVEKLFAPHAGGVNVVVASRYEAGEIFTIEDKEVPKEVMKTRKKALKGLKNENQLSLF